MTEAYLVGGVRTPVGRYGGALGSVRPDDLASIVVREAALRAGIDPLQVEIDEVILGAANQAGEDNRNVARMAVLLAGLPDSVPGITVNRLCASGMSAVTMAAQAVRAGDADVILAGGVESMTRAPWVQAKPEKAWAKPGAAFDTSIGWRFPNPRLLAREKATFSMPETAEEVARVDGISRDEADAFALRSQERAAAAIAGGRFEAEIVGVPVGSGEVTVDEGPRPETTLEGLARLRPVVAGGQVVTAGNSSALNDGASAIVVASAAAVERYGLVPRARIVAGTSAGLAPEVMGLGPGSRDSEGAATGGPLDRRHRLDRAQRGLRHAVHRLHPTARPRRIARERRRVEPSPWATLSVRPGPGCWSPSSAAWNARGRATAWPPCASASDRAPP